MPGLLWPAARYVGTSHPQGVVAAPVGAMFIRLDTGSIYRKVGGGATAFGWYLEASPRDGRTMQWSVRTIAAAAQIAQQVGATAPLACAPSTILQGPAVGTAANPTRHAGQWTGGYTTAVATNSWILAPSAVLTGVPTDWIAADGGPINALNPWDATFTLLTTPRVSTAGASTSLAAIRIWCGILFQNATIQATGASVDSDAIYAGFPSSMVAGAASASYGAMFRFSTAAADAGWAVVTCNDNGAVSAQTVTPTGVAVAVDTIYRLRLRFVLSAGVWQIRASVNDGAEVIITANVGPGSVVAAAGVRKPLVPYVQCRTLAAAAKSLGVGDVILQYGEGCEL